MLSETFEMEVLGKHLLCLVLKSKRPVSWFIGFIQKAYINCVIKRFNMEGCSPCNAHIVKGDRYSKSRCLRNDLEREENRSRIYLALLDLYMLRFALALI